MQHQTTMHTLIGVESFARHEHDAMASQANGSAPLRALLCIFALYLSEVSLCAASEQGLSLKACLRFYSMRI
jgi:hypothetical protein